MIYLIDEDLRKLRSLVFELRILGYDVEQISNADEGFNRLCDIEPSAVDLVIVDVMLSAHHERLKSRYTIEATESFQKTGLVLVKDLVNRNPSVFPSFAVFLTHAADRQLVDEVNRTAREYNMNVLRKRDFNTSWDLARHFDGYIKLKRGVA